MSDNERLATQIEDMAGAAYEAAVLAANAAAEMQNAEGLTPRVDALDAAIASLALLKAELEGLARELRRDPSPERVEEIRAEALQIIRRFPRAN